MCSATKMSLCIPSQYKPSSWPLASSAPAVATDAPTAASYTKGAPIIDDRLHPPRIASVALRRRGISNVAHSSTSAAPANSTHVDRARSLPAVMLSASTLTTTANIVTPIAPACRPAARCAFKTSVLTRSLTRGTIAYLIFFSAVCPTSLHPRVQRAEFGNYKRSIETRPVRLLP